MQSIPSVEKKPSRSINRARLIYWTDVTACAGGLLVFATGLVLLLRFHVGPGGATRAAALGMSRLAWVNVHRLAAVLTVTALAVHVQLHWRVVWLKLARLFRHASGRVSTQDAVLYLGFALVAAAGFAAWWLLPGSPPFLLLEPSSWTALPPPRERHAVIDVHNLVGLIVLVTVVMHVRPHLGWLHGRCRVAQANRS